MTPKSCGRHGSLSAIPLVCGAAPCPGPEAAHSPVCCWHCSFPGLDRNSNFFSFPSAELSAVLNTSLEKLVWRASFSPLFPFVIPFHISCLSSRIILWSIVAVLLSKSKCRDKMWHFHVFVFLVQFWLFTLETLVVLSYAAILRVSVVRQANDSEAVKSVNIVCSV